MVPRAVRRLAPWMLLGLAACGEAGGGGPRGPGSPGKAPAVDASSPDAVWKAAHAALAAGDLAALDPWLTEAGRARVRRDLEAWRALLADPSTGPRMATRVRLPDDAEARAAAQAALAGGDPAALLRLYVAAAPRGPFVPLPPRPGDGDRIDLEVAAPDGGTRPVRLVRGADGWRVERLGL